VFEATLRWNWLHELEHACSSVRAASSLRTVFRQALRDAVGFEEWEHPSSLSLSDYLPLARPRIKVDIRE
jgi:hypothetical protein